jgi:hypothetical protein
MLSVLLCGREELLVTSREEDRLRLSGRRLLRSKLKPTRKKYKPIKNYTLGKFTIFILSPQTVTD